MKTGYPHAEERNWTLISHHIQKLTQNGLRPETIRLLGESIVKKLLHIGLGYEFLVMTLETQATKAKIDKWDYIRLKSFFKAKETMNRVKRQPIDWEKIFASHIFDKKLIFKIYKELTQLNNKTKTTPQFKNGQRT